jgi:hypothetical protein
MFSFHCRRLKTRRLILSRYDVVFFRLSKALKARGNVEVISFCAFPRGERQDPESSRYLKSWWAYCFTLYSSYEDQLSFSIRDLDHGSYIRHFLTIYKIHDVGSSSSSSASPTWKWTWQGWSRSQFSRQQQVSQVMLQSWRSLDLINGTHRGSPRPAPRVRGDGTSAKTALWSKQLWDNPRQRQFLVHRRTQPSSSRWARCTEQEARYDAETGFTVWELGARAGRLVDLLTGRDGRPQFVPFQWQLDEVIAEERARIARHEPIPGEEDILEGD